MKFIFHDIVSERVMERFYFFAFQSTNLCLLHFILEVYTKTSGKKIFSAHIVVK
jgi:hypothetical protein